MGYEYKAAYHYKITNLSQTSALFNDMGLATQICIKNWHYSPVAHVSLRAVYKTHVFQKCTRMIPSPVLHCSRFCELEQPAQHTPMFDMHTACTDGKGVYTAGPAMPALSCVLPARLVVYHLCHTGLVIQLTTLSSYRIRCKAASS